MERVHFIVMFSWRGNRQPLLDENERLRAEVERLNLERDAALPTADRHGEPGELRYLFVVTYGRSGSTLLMGLLNSLPGYCIRGENQGVLYELFQYHTKVLDARTAHSTDRPLTARDAWYGIDGYPTETALRRMRKLVTDTLLRPSADIRVTGFKEIRWWMPKPVEYLDFIEEVFPGARFILNTRNHEDVAKSSWYVKHPDPLKDLEGVELRLKDAIARRDDRGYHVHYDDYVKDPDALRGLWEWLGEDYNSEQVRSVLAAPHSTSRRRTSDADESRTEYVR